MLRRLFGLMVAAIAGLVAIFLYGMRTKDPKVLDAVREVNRKFFNPMQMESAGTPGAYASIIRHTGRKSGSVYETPIGAKSTDDGFVITLPYGTRADWVQNVLAAGSAELVHEGATYRVDQPEVVPIDSSGAQFTETDERTMRVFGVEEGLRLRRAAAVAEDQLIDVR